MIEGMKAGILLNARVTAHERVTLERIRAEGLRARDARVALLEGLLREHEWGGELPYDSVSYPVPRRFCLFCYGDAPHGHGPGCRFVAAAADGG